MAAAEGWERVVAAHLERCPLATAADVYKFVHQSVFGPAHFVPDPEQARAYLEREMAGLEGGPAAEPLLEELSDTLVRVNLRPFLAAGGDGEALVAALVESARSVVGDPALMEARLAAAVRVLERLGRREDSAALAALARELAGRGFPAIEHSQRYRAAYRPAYRVVLRRLAEGALVGRR